MRGKPRRLRRGGCHVTWKRIDRLASEHSPDALRARIDELIATDDQFQARYGVPEPGAVSTADLPVDDHEALEAHWRDRTEWRTVRRDIRVLRRAVERAEDRLGDGVRA